MRLLVAMTVLALNGGTLVAQGKEVLKVPGAVDGIPFSPVVKVGNLLFLSGQIGNVPGTRQLADTGIAGQTRQTLENIKALLAAAVHGVHRCVVGDVGRERVGARGEVHGVPGRHRRLRSDERRVRRLLSQGSRRRAPPWRGRAWRWVRG